MLDEDIMTIKELHAKKMLHWRIIYRISILLGYSLWFVGLASYRFFADNLNFFSAVLLFSLGFLLGLFFVSRMFGIYWDEERGMITSGRVDAFGISMILLYVALRVWLDDALDYVLHPGAVKLSGLAFCLIGGIMVGRFLATIITIKKIHVEKKTDAPTH